MQCGLLGICLLCVGAAAADLAGLQQQSETKITAQIVGAPFEGDKPPFVWAMSFSPDGHSLALGVQFARKKRELAFRSYLVVVSADRPNVALMKFETPTQVELRNLHTIVWSADNKFLAVTPWGDWEHAGFLDVEGGQVHVFLDRVGATWCSRAEGVVSGPKVVQSCTSNSENTIRFVDLQGTAEVGWTFQQPVSILQVSPDRRMLALDVVHIGDKLRRANLHELVILNLADRTEIRRWSLPAAAAYSGSFAAFGAEFCFVADPAVADIEHEIVCQNLKTGDVTAKSTLPRGPVSLSAVGDKLIVSRSDVVILPFRLLGTKFFFKGANQGISSGSGGRALAQWRVPWNDDVNFASAVSESGESVAIAESAKLRVYRVIP